MLQAAGLASGLGAGLVAALIQLQGPALRPGILAGSVTLPLERAAGGDTPVLSLRSDGRPVRFLVDTGASSTLVSPDLVKRLGLASTPIPPADFGLAGAGNGCGTLQPRRTSLPPLSLSTQSLATQRLPTQSPPSEAPGTLSLIGAEALVLPVGGLPPDVDGVLGAPQLRQLPLWIDPRGSVLAFGRSALQAADQASDGRASNRGSGASGEVTLPLRWHRGVPLLSLVTGSRAGTVQALADTGAEGLFVTPELAMVLPALGSSQPLRVAGFCGEQPASWTRVQGPSLSGRRPAAPVQAILTANPVFQALGVEAIVGQELLRPHRQLWRLEATPPTLRLW
ncbi:retropepsin-like aspartic protease [Synechococcus sp. CS-1328]|uniref:retropepsin-like aspartic protease n=1 Tax=Synechococcus sp. CS-1328 TaxID=2847976 RepID=UPI00223AB89C|nr:aspartyl protease family protein [Synechococcus sp. CS-1328]MCT0223884.1 aspartyl protease family protein [Synechococcus sp. CS-1328]